MSSQLTAIAGAKFFLALLVGCLAAYGAFSLAQGLLVEDPVAVWTGCDRGDAERSGCLQIVVSNGRESVSERECGRRVDGFEDDLGCAPTEVLRLTPKQQVEISIAEGASRVEVSYFKGGYDRTSVAGSRFISYVVSANKVTDEIMKRGSRRFTFEAPAGAGSPRYAEIVAWNGSSESATFAFRYQVR